MPLLLVIECADTDVLMWLCAKYNEIPYNTYFQTSKLKRLIKIRDAVSVITAERINALIGFYFLVVQVDEKLQSTLLLRRFLRQIL